MSATSIADLLKMTRNHLREPKARFWTDEELLALMNLGKNDLWGAINDNFKEYFVKLDATNVTFPANSTALAGIPEDLFRVELIEARDLTDNSNLVFVAKDYRDADFVSARSNTPQDPAGVVLYFTLLNEGAPVSAPTIKVSPMVNTSVDLTLLYVPTLPKIEVGDANPVPGESDGALVAWTVAFARTKERDDGSPDPAWIEVYASEKKNLLTRMTPRQTQDPETADAMFEQYW